MTAIQFDALLAAHCAPALAGIKSANLISVKREAAEGLGTLISNYSRVLNRDGIAMELLGSFERYALLLVYRPELLWNALLKNRDFLRLNGYTDWSNLDSLLSELKKRCREHFVPCEIGMFLDYPLEEVIAFAQGTLPCRLCGYWKVYHDVAYAKKRFREFTLCRETYDMHLKNGETLFQIVQNNHKKEDAEASP